MGMKQHYCRQIDRQGENRYGLHYVRSSKIIYFLSLLPWKLPSSSMKASTKYHGSIFTSMEASTNFYFSKSVMWLGLGLGLQ